MRKRRLLAIFALVTALMLGAPPSGARDGPQVVDPAGDANGTRVPGLGDTRPASYDPADFLSILWETTHTPIPVGADGVHHQPTGLRATVQTLASPDSTTFTVAFRLGFEMPGCFDLFDVYVQGNLPDQQDPWDRYVEWFQNGPECPDGGGSRLHHPAWKVDVDAGSRRLVLTLPFDSMNEVEAAHLAPGRTIGAPRGLTSFLFRYAGQTAWFPEIDFTENGEDFVIGSDLPPDVPCTRDCPGG